FFYSFMVIVVPARFSQHKNVLMRPHGSVPYTVGHGIGAIPYDIAPQEPSIVPKGECHCPGNTHKIFFFYTHRGQVKLADGKTRTSTQFFLSGASTTPTSTSITITKVKE